MSEFHTGDAVVHAVQYVAADPHAALEFLRAHNILHDQADDGRAVLRVYGPHGGLDVRPTQWIVRSSDGALSVASDDAVKGWSRPAPVEPPANPPPPPASAPAEHRHSPTARVTSKPPEAP